VKTINDFHRAYEDILRSDKPEEQKGREYAVLMQQIERAYQIPIIRSPKFEIENRKVIALYRKISMTESR